MSKNKSWNTLISNLTPPTKMSTKTFAISSLKPSNYPSKEIMPISNSSMKQLKQMVPKESKNTSSAWKMPMNFNALPTLNSLPFANFILNSAKIIGKVFFGQMKKISPSSNCWSFHQGIKNKISSSFFNFLKEVWQAKFIPQWVLKPYCSEFSRQWFKATLKIKTCMARQF